MTFPLHDRTATSTAFLDHMPPLLSTHEGMSVHVNPLYTFPYHLWASSDPTLGWPYPPAQVDSHLLMWPTVNNIPLASHVHGTTLTNYFHTDNPPYMMNPGHNWTRDPQVEDTSPNPISTRNSTSYIGETTLDKHTSPQDLTAYEAQKTKITKRDSSPSEPETFKCKWEGCIYDGTFGVKSSLWRHIQSTHIAPDSLKCPVPKCRKAFGRRDKYNAHVRLVHGDIPDLVDNHGP